MGIAKSILREVEGLNPSDHLVGERRRDRRLWICRADRAGFTISRSLLARWRSGRFLKILVQLCEQGRRKKFHQSHRQGAGKVVIVRLASLDIGGNDTEVPLADIKNESRRPIGSTRRDNTAGTVERLKAVIARSGLATDRNDITIG